MNFHAVGFNVIPTLQGSSIFVLTESRVLPLKTGGTAESSVLSIFIRYAGTFLLEKISRGNPYLLNYPHHQRREPIMKQISGNKLLVKALKEEGVDVLFGYPGACTIDISDELI